MAWMYKQKIRFAKLDNGDIPTILRYGRGYGIFIFSF